MKQGEVVATLAIVTGALGMVSTVPFSSPVQAVLLTVFVLGGPGCAVMCWGALPPAVTAAAVVGLSVAVVFATAVAMAWVPFWGPTPSCVLLSAVVVGSGALRLRALRRSTSEGAVRW